MLSHLPVILATLRARIEQIRADERGYTTETVLVTAVLVAGAIVILGILVAAVTRKANEIGGSM